MRRGKPRSRAVHWKSMPDSIGSAMRSRLPSRVALADERWCENVFSYCRPVPEASYRQAVATGKWPDHALAGHNRPPEGIDAIRAELDDLRMRAEQLVRAGPAKTQADADAAANLKARIASLTEALETEQELEVAPERQELQRIEQAKRPVLERISATEQRYAPILVSARSTLRKLTDAVIFPFLSEQRRKARETGQSQQTRSGGAIAPSASAGAKNAKTFLATVWRAEIEDYDKALAALAQHGDVRACVQKICDAAARSRAKLPIDGVRYIPEEKAR
jgi:hypothetical protein